MMSATRIVFFFKQKTAYELRISDWSSDVCSSDLYEAFAMKMLGGLRQEIVFARRQREIGQEPGWISVPLIVTSHTWENSKNEQSHQDPTIGEALLGEMSDTARVLFPEIGRAHV